MAIQLSDHFTYSRLIRFVVPSIIMMVFTSVYGVVDGLFVSNFVGKSAFAAINLIMPFIMIFGGLGFMLGTGGSALVAKTLGEKRNEQAKRYFTMMVYITIIAGAVACIIGIAAMRPVAKLLGASEALIGDCVTYGRISLVFGVAFMLQNVFQGFFITAEKPQLGLYTTIAAGVANMVLDAVFIALFKWGVAGAALATGVSQCVGGIIPLFYFARKNDSLLQLTKTKLEFKPIMRACSNGLSEMVSNATASIVGMLYNLQLLKYAGENGIAAYGVIMYVQFIFISIFIGYAVGCAPIVSYNYGAGNHGELKNMLKKSMVLMWTTGVVMALAAQVLAKHLAGVFVGYDKELFELTARGFRIFSMAFLLIGFNIFASSFFTALNNGVVSAVISLLRTFVFKLSAVFILPLMLGVDGIWTADFSAEVFAALISALFMVKLRKRYKYM